MVGRDTPEPNACGDYVRPAYAGDGQRCKNPPALAVGSVNGPVLEDSNDLYKQYYAYLRESVGPIRLNDDDLLEVADQIFKICDDTLLYLAGHGGTVSEAFELDIVTETDTYVMEFHDKERNEIIGQLYRLLHEEVPVTKGD